MATFTFIFTSRRYKKSKQISQYKLENEMNKSVFSFVNSAVNMAFAAERRAGSPCCGAVVDGRPAPARRSAANPPHAAAAVE